MWRPGHQGLSVTIPHKEQIVRRLSYADEQVRAIGAANTVVIDGVSLSGFNTDCDAAVDSVVEGIGETLQANPFTDRVALILGAGGAARAIAYGLHARGAEVVVSNRSLGRARDLGERIGVRHVPWEDFTSVKAGILVNCTPVGMHPNVDESPCPKSYLRRDMVIFDAVYNPEQTLFIKQARDVGCRTVTGVDMFVRQAAKQFQHFTGDEAPQDVMREAVRRAIGAAKY